MLDRLPYVYAAVLIAELTALTLRWFQGAPAASAPLSVALGWVGIASMVFLLVYSVARRSRALRRRAKLSYWLHFHIFLALQGVMAVLFHSSHLFMKEAPINPLNPGFLSGVATLIVFLSGLFGRYVYSLLPRTPDGVDTSGGRAALSDRIFRSWIILHRPLAAALYVVAVVHILFSYMFSSALAQ